MAAGGRRAVLLGGALALAAALGVGFSLTRVPPGERAFRVSRFGGDAAKLEPGTHLVPPLLFRVVRLPVGPMKAKGTLPVRSREGAELVAGYDVEADLPDGALARW